MQRPRHASVLGVDWAKQRWTLQRRRASRRLSQPWKVSLRATRQAPSCFVLWAQSCCFLQKDDSGSGFESDGFDRAGLRRIHIAAIQGDTKTLQQELDG